jgi:F1F0 ATPase subunit 2
MNEALTMVLAWVVGCLLGVIFFGGLWWTVRKSIAAKQPALWIFGSLLVRMSIVLAGFYLFSGSHLGRLFLCLLGFLTARLAVIRLTRPSRERQICLRPEAKHAP